MKKWIMAAAAIISLTISSALFAGPLLLPKNPLYFSYETAEQYSQKNDINNSSNPLKGGTTEGNWGIVEVSSIVIGKTIGPTGSQIAPLGPSIFSNTIGGQQILGIFFGVQNDPLFPGISTGGTLDLYSWDSNSQDVVSEFNNANLQKRGGVNGSQYAGFTCLPNTSGCTFLARFRFTPGADINSQIHTIFSPPGSSYFESYLSVDVTTPGDWTDLLDSNFFSLNPVNQTCGNIGVSCISSNDLRADGNFTQTGAGGWDISGTDIIGLSKDGAFRAFVVPEPDSLALVGLSLAMLSVVGIRSRSGTHPHI